MDGTAKRSDSPLFREPSVGLDRGGTDNMLISPRQEPATTEAVDSQSGAGQDRAAERALAHRDPHRSRLTLHLHVHPSLAKHLYHSNSRLQILACQPYVSTAIGRQKG